MTRALYEQATVPSDMPVGDAVTIDDTLGPTVHLLTPNRGMQRFTTSAQR